MTRGRAPMPARRARRRRRGCSLHLDRTILAIRMWPGCGEPTSRAQRVAAPLAEKASRCSAGRAWSMPCSLNRKSEQRSALLAAESGARRAPVNPAKSRPRRYNHRGRRCAPCPATAPRRPPSWRLDDFYAARLLIRFLHRIRGPGDSHPFKMVSWPFPVTRVRHKFLPSG